MITAAFLAYAIKAGSFYDETYASILAVIGAIVMDFGLFVYPWI